MTEHLLCVLAAGGRIVPARVCGLLAQRDMSIITVQASTLPGAPYWWIQIALDLDAAGEVELAVKRLNRLVDVIKVIEVSAEASHQRRSMFVRVRPATGELIHVTEIARLFRAEVIEATPDGTTLYLSTSPPRCQEFLALLTPYDVVEAVVSAISAIRSGSPGFGSWTTPHGQFSRFDRQNSLRLNA